MKPTPTPEQIEAAMEKTPFLPNHINRAWMAEALSAALSVPAEAVVGEPEGWKLVPIEPTENMVKAADAAGDERVFVGEAGSPHIRPGTGGSLLATDAVVSLLQPSLRFLRGAAGGNAGLARCNHGTLPARQHRRGGER